MNTQSSLFRTVTNEEIASIFSHALQESHIERATLLDGGMFNTTYRVVYGDQKREAVLRLGPVNRERLMGFERNLMQAEKYVCDVCVRIGIPTSHILACDTSKSVIDRDFMIVEYIPSVVMVNAALSEEKRNALCFDLGAYLAKLHGVTGDSFGFVSRILEGNRFLTWSEALLFEVVDITDHLAHMNGLPAAEIEAIRSLFLDARPLLDEIKTPHLLHTDLWAGNVLLDQNDLSIKAIIDGDRAVFGDPDFEFSSPWMEDVQMQRGYGFLIPQAGEENRKQRMKLYRMFYLLLEAYVGIGEYNNLNLYRERTQQLREMLKTI